MLSRSQVDVYSTRAKILAVPEALPVEKIYHYIPPKTSAAKQQLKQGDVCWNVCTCSPYQKDLCAGFSLEQ
jgi:hypothetical protein